MKIYNNSAKRMISVMIPEEFHDMDESYMRILNDVNHLARACDTTLFFSPSNQRASVISKCIAGSCDERMSEIMPKYNWTLEQEIADLPGIVLVPDDTTSPAELREKINELLIPNTPR